MSTSRPSFASSFHVLLAVALATAACDVGRSPQSYAEGPPPPGFGAHTGDVRDRGHFCVVHSRDPKLAGALPELLMLWRGTEGANSVGGREGILVRWSVVREGEEPDPATTVVVREGPAGLEAEVGGKALDLTHGRVLLFDRESFLGHVEPDAELLLPWRNDADTYAPWEAASEFDAIFASFE